MSEHLVLTGTLHEKVREKIISEHGDAVVIASWLCELVCSACGVGNGGDPYCRHCGVAAEVTRAESLRREGGYE